MNQYARFLVSRLIRHLERQSIEDFVHTGYLIAVDRSVDSGIVRRYRPSETFPVMTGNDSVDLDRLRRLATGLPQTGYGTMAKPNASTSSGKSERKVARRKKPDTGRNASVSAGTDAATGAPGVADRGSLPSNRELRLVRHLARRPRTHEIVTLLLVGRMLDGLSPDERSVLSAFTHNDLPSGILTLMSEVGGLESILGSLIRAGVLAPDGINFVRSNGVDCDFSPPSRHRHALERPLIRIDEDVSSSSDDILIRMRLGEAMESGHQLLYLSEDQQPIPKRLRAAADLCLTIRPIDWTIIAETVGLVLGRPVSAETVAAACPGVDPASLGLEDLTIAIRPGRSLAEITRTLRSMSIDADGEDTAASDDRASRQGSNTSSSGHASGSSKAGKSTGSDFVRPVPEFVTLNSRTGQPIPRVEDLHGYGEAKQWALDLKTDLDLWRSGEARWSDLSTRLLLSGSPGTGKTSFARALCNTLGLPLLATSMARWLEGGHLGEVLRRMSAAFEEAKANVPCILFIDEIDNLGKRSVPSRDHDDYWQSLVNRMLELLDGTIKAEGVIIVGATNLPERIDEAILRSGRLERHIVIPQPDATALVGILAHHLCADLPGIIATAPQEFLEGSMASAGHEQSPVERHRLNEVPSAIAGTEAATGADEDDIGVSSRP